jgi:hypothetical protein
MRIRSTQRGILLVIAIVSLAVMLTLGGTLVSLTTQQMAYSKNQLRNLHSIAMADAGLNYVIWDKKWSATDAPNLPSNQHAVVNAALQQGVDPRGLSTSDGSRKYVTLQLGTSDDDIANVWLFNYTINGTNGYQLISRGHYQGFNRNVRALLQGDTSTGGGSGGGTDPTYPPAPSITNYALYSGTNLTVGGQTTVNGLVGSNGNFTTSGQASIDGGINAAGSVTLAKQSTIVGPVAFGTTYDDKGATGAHTSSKTGQTTPFPTVDLAAWKAFAQTHGMIVNGSLNISGTAAYNKPVVYVTGDVTFSGQSKVTGPVTIISEGTVHLSGQITTDPAPPSDKANMTLVAAKGAKFTGQTNVNATIYTHSATSDADAMGSGQATIYGSLIADTLSGSGQFVINYRKPNSSVLPPSDPGGGGGSGSGDNYQWNVASWEPL